MIEVRGVGHIVARIVSDSISPNGTRLTTFEFEYPRFIHSEFMTHRMLSKNSASSRAIPAAKMRQHIFDVPQEPVSWGKNKAGMQADEELDEYTILQAKSLWNAARESAITFHKVMEQTGVHKQIVNRLTEAFMQMKVVSSGTEWANFFWLRDHKDADPTIAELARCAKEAMLMSTPVELQPDEWHLPYIDTVWDLESGDIYYKTSRGEIVDLETAKKVSASCCAQVSYRILDDSIPKALSIFDRLINSVPVHASPVEHQATPMRIDAYSVFPEGWDPGVTHMRKDYSFWSGNFKDWVQHRQLLENHTQW